MAGSVTKGSGCGCKWTGDNAWVDVSEGIGFSCGCVCDGVGTGSSVKVDGMMRTLSTEARPYHGPLSSIARHTCHRMAAPCVSVSSQCRVPVHCMVY